MSLENESGMLFDTSLIDEYTNDDKYVIKNIFNKQSRAATLPRQYKIRWALYWKKLVAKEIVFQITNIGIY